MKIPQYFLILFAVSFVTTACAQNISGNGNVVEENRPVESFSSIDVGGVLNVYLTQGDTESVTVEADENLLDLIITENRGNTLVVKLKKGIDIKKAKDKNVYITLRSIDELEVGGVVNVKSTNALTADAFDLDIGGVGNTDLELRCDRLNAKADMVGNLTLSGEVREANIRNGGVGSLKAFDLKVDRLTIKNSGVGSAEVQAQEEISINSSGVGSVRYKGDPVVKELSTSGVGKVKKM
ncbi:MAG: head GIN domain-containing protein [Tunicatimonas sp.]